MYAVADYTRNGPTAQLPARGPNMPPVHLLGYGRNGERSSGTRIKSSVSASHARHSRRFEGFSCRLVASLETSRSWAKIHFLARPESTSGEHCRSNTRGLRKRMVIGLVPGSDDDDVGCIGGVDRTRWRCRRERLRLGSECPGRSVRGGARVMHRRHDQATLPRRFAPPRSTKPATQSARDIHATSIRELEWSGRNCRELDRLTPAVPAGTPMPSDERCACAPEHSAD